MKIPPWNPFLPFWFLVGNNLFQIYIKALHQNASKVSQSFFYIFICFSLKLKKIIESNVKPLLSLNSTFNNIGRVREKPWHHSSKTTSKLKELFIYLYTCNIAVSLQYVQRLQRCWLQNFAFVNIFWKRPTSQSCHQHISSPTSVTNIGVASFKDNFMMLYWCKKSLMYEVWIFNLQRILG